MTDYESEMHATVTVRRSGDGSIDYVQVRAEYFEHAPDLPEHDDDKFRAGVSAKYRFEIEDDQTARYEGVLEIDDGASGNQITSLDFLKSAPVAEEAVLNVPGVEAVECIEEKLGGIVSIGREASSE